MTGSAELKPCPFCGGADIRNVSNNHPGPSHHLHANDTIFAVNCGSCGASVPNRYKNDLVIAAWNRRSPADAPDGWRTVMEDLVEELEEQVCYRYQGYPPNDRRFVRDMLTVKEAREFLEAHKDKP